MLHLKPAGVERGDALGYRGGPAHAGDLPALRPLLLRLLHRAGEPGPQGCRDGAAAAGGGGGLRMYCTGVALGP